MVWSLKKKRARTVDYPCSRCASSRSSLRGGRGHVSDEATAHEAATTEPDCTEPSTRSLLGCQTSRILYGKNSPGRIWQRIGESAPVPFIHTLMGWCIAGALVISAVVCIFLFLSESLLFLAERPRQIFLFFTERLLQFEQSLLLATWWRVIPLRRSIPLRRGAIRLARLNLSLFHLANRLLQVTQIPLQVFSSSPIAFFSGRTDSRLQRSGISLSFDHRYHHRLGHIWRSSSGSAPTSPAPQSRQHLIHGRNRVSTRATR